MAVVGEFLDGQEFTAAEEAGNACGESECWAKSRGHDLLPFIVTVWFATVNFLSVVCLPKWSCAYRS
jgi:hypothetical protein